MNKIFIAFVSLFFLATTKAEVLRDRDDDGTSWCMLQGVIRKQDVVELSNALRLGCKEVLLNSPGGDVDSAIQMGRALRNAQIPVIVPKKMQCASACVLLYAGGVVRLNYGPINIHRPYTTSFSESYESSQRKFKQMEENVKKYLHSMNVNDQLFEKMIRISPDKTETLTLEDLEELGLGFKDPVYDNHLDLIAAKQNGVPLQVWLEAKIKARRECGDIDKPSENSAASKAEIECWNRLMPLRK